jgi:hypothetical protein
MMVIDKRINKCSNDDSLYKRVYNTRARTRCSGLQPTNPCGTQVYPKRHALLSKMLADAFNLLHLPSAPHIPNSSSPPPTVGAEGAGSDSQATEPVACVRTRMNPDTDPSEHVACACTACTHKLDPNTPHTDAGRLNGFSRV